MARAKERGSKPADKPSGRTPNGVRGAAVARAIAARLPRRPGPYACAAFAAAMAAIVVNATALQRERLPAPFFAAKPAPAVAAAPPPAQTVAAVNIAAVTVAPAPPPARAPAPPAPAATPSHSPDRIAEFLRGGAGKEGQRVVSTTQAALVKLGYSVKVTGSVNAETVGALREFEKSRNLPASSDITPRLAKIVLAAANERGVR